MRIVLVRAPDTGKAKFAEQLNNKYRIPWTRSPNYFLENLYLDIPAIGFMADYRTELLLASERACGMSLEKNMVFTHSVLDNLAYATTIISLNITSKIISDQWFSCYTIFTNLFHDSFQHDLVIRFPYKGDDEMMITLENNLNFF